MKVLALSAHTDDVEYGAGGYLGRLLEEGHSIRLLTFSTGNADNGANRTEHRRAMEVFGIENYILLEFETRTFERQRQVILDWMCAEGESFQPDLVLCSGYGDCHQDHIVVRDEAVRAYRRSSILGYELPWSNPFGFCPRFYVPLEQRHLNLKIAALSEYRSQWGKRHYMEAKIVQATMLMRGQQINYGYAEAFEVIRWIWKG